MDFIDVLEFSPLILSEPKKALETTIEDVMMQVDGYIGGAIRVVEQVVPEMVEKGEGSLLFTTGLSAMYPMPIMGHSAIAMPALRSYVKNLHADLSDKGIYVGHFIRYNDEIRYSNRPKLCSRYLV
jgi:NADP-dependent 3-hydroxy acid dehydrogenase YdfG